MSGALNGFGSGPFLAQQLDALQCKFEAFASGFRTGNQLFDVGEGLRIAEFAAQFLEKWMNLGEEEEHFSADGGLQKQIGIECAA